MAANQLVSKTDDAGSSPALTAWLSWRNWTARHGSNVMAVGSTPTESACVPVAQLDRALACEGNDGSSPLAALEGGQGCPGTLGSDGVMASQHFAKVSSRKAVRVQVSVTPLVVAVAQWGERYFVIVGAPDRSRPVTPLECLGRARRLPMGRKHCLGMQRTLNPRSRVQISVGSPCSCCMNGQCPSLLSCEVWVRVPPGAPVGEGRSRAGEFAWRPTFAVVGPG